MQAVVVVDKSGQYMNALGTARVLISRTPVVVGEVVGTAAAGGKGFVALAGSVTEMITLSAEGKVL